MRIKIYSSGDSVKVPRTTSWRNRKFKSRNLTKEFVLSSDQPARYISKDDVLTLPEVQSPTYDEHLSGFDKEVQEEEMLFKGASVTKPEGILLLFGFITKHKLTRFATKELLLLLSRFVPSTCHLPSSYNDLMKVIPKDESITTNHFYCEACQEYLEQSSLICPACQKTFIMQNLWNNGDFFTTFDLRKSISSLLNDSKISRELQENLANRNRRIDGVFTDIVDGRLYRSLELTGEDFSCAMNTDGIPVFKSSKSSLWPILISINELSYKTRSRNCLLAAVWFGKSKPNFDILFKPLMLEFRALSTNYLEWVSNNRRIQSKVYFPIMVNDSVARCLCQGLHQFNGTFGCTWCLMEGELFAIEGSNARKRIYPGSQTAEIRTQDNFIHQLKEFRSILETNPRSKSHFGIKQATPLLTLPKFNVVHGFTFDYMHTSFLGVSRTFAELWLDSKNHSQQFYIGRMMNKINSRLLKFSVPHSFDRTIRSLEERKFWKATEWRTWMYICGIILKGILPDHFLQHFFKYTEAMMLLSQRVVTQIHIDMADKLLNEFVKTVEVLYGKSHCSYNIHLLTHATTCVQNWGPLWAYSAFQFESFNGVLLNMFNGNRKIDIEISNQVVNLASAISMSRTLKQTEAVAVFHTNLQSKKLRKNVLSINGIHFYGYKKLYFLNKSDRISLNDLGIESAGNSCYSFSSCLVNGNFYSTEAERSTRKCNYVTEIGGCIYIIEKLLAISPDPVCVAKKLTVRKSKFSAFSFFVVPGTNRSSFFKLSSCNSKYICARDSSAITDLVRLPNSIEIE